MQDIYKDHPPTIASADRPHLDFLKFGRLAQVSKIKMVINAAKKNGIGKASEISRLLNKLLIKTAIGDKWTPRLVWFAVKAMTSKAEDPGERKATRASRTQAYEDAKFRDMVKRVVKSRLDEISDEFEASKPTLGEASAELADLKMRLERKLN
jgi:hypothetical protein